MSGISCPKSSFSCYACKHEYSLYREEKGDKGLTLFEAIVQVKGTGLGMSYGVTGLWKASVGEMTVGSTPSKPLGGGILWEKYSLNI